MNEWGPLAALAGMWEGNDGLDVSFHNLEGRVGKTGYLEKTQLKPFGPVDNGDQCLAGETNPVRCKCVPVRTFEFWIR